MLLSVSGMGLPQRPPMLVQDLCDRPAVCENEWNTQHLGERPVLNSVTVAQAQVQSQAEAQLASFPHSAIASQPKPALVEDEACVSAQYECRCLAASPSSVSFSSSSPASAGTFDSTCGSTVDISCDTSSVSHFLDYCECHATGHGSMIDGMASHSTSINSLDEAYECLSETLSKDSQVLGTDIWTGYFGDRGIF